MPVSPLQTRRAAAREGRCLLSFNALRCQPGTHHMKENLVSLPRRHVLAGTAGALAAVGLASWSTRAAAQAKPLPAYATWKDASTLIVHSSNTMETRRAAFGTSVITPADQLYVRNNLPPPDASVLNDRDAWVVSIEGVKNPRSITLG